MPKLQAIEETQRAVEVAMAKVIVYLKLSTTPTSEEARTVIEETLQILGCESPEGSIVAPGVQGAEPHAEGSGVIQKGEPIIIDIFPRNKQSGYFADMSRTVCLGEPSERAQQMYDAVLGAQTLAFSMLKPGVRGEEIQRAVEQFFEQKGFLRKNPRPQSSNGWSAEEGFIHSVGHGVGQEIHEPPKIGIGTDVLEEDVVVTIEPGLYYKDVGGVRLEDMVLITKDGYRNLTNFPKQFVL